MVTRRLVGFFTEGDTAALLDANYLKKPSPFFWECTEESTVLVGDLTNESNILEQYPSLQKLIRQMLEENLGRSQTSLSSYISSSPEQRYLDLVRTRAGPASESPSVSDCELSWNNSRIVESY